VKFSRSVSTIPCPVAVAVRAHWFNGSRHSGFRSSSEVVLESPRPVATTQQKDCRKNRNQDRIESPRPVADALRDISAPTATHRIGAEIVARRDDHVLRTLPGGPFQSHPAWFGRSSRLVDESVCSSGGSVGLLDRRLGLRDFRRLTGYSSSVDCVDCSVEGGWFGSDPFRRRQRAYPPPSGTPNART